LAARQPTLSGLSKNPARLTQPSNDNREVEDRRAKLLQILETTDLTQIFAPYRGQLGKYNQWIVPQIDPDQYAGETDVIPATRLLEPEFLVDLLSRWDTKLGTNNLKVEASLWIKYYCNVIFPPVLGAMSLGGLGLDASLANTSLVLSRTAGLKKLEGPGYPIRAIFGDSPRTVIYGPRCAVPGQAERAIRPVNSVAELHQVVFKQLFEGHFAPLFEQFQSVTAVSKKVLWGSLGAAIFGFYQQLGDRVGSQAASLEDAPALLDSPENTDIAPGKNPLYHPVQLRFLNDAALPDPVRIRNSCCLWYKVPGAQRCTTCPLLKPEERAELLKVKAAKKAG
jgi:siderophore-iron reductase FhuF